MLPSECRSALSEDAFKRASLANLSFRVDFVDHARKPARGRITCHLPVGDQDYRHGREPDGRLHQVHLAMLVQEQPYAIGAMGGQISSP